MQIDKDEKINMIKFMQERNKSKNLSFVIKYEKKSFKSIWFFNFYLTAWKNLKYLFAKLLKTKLCISNEEPEEIIKTG